MIRLQAPTLSTCYSFHEKVSTSPVANRRYSSVLVLYLNIPCTAPNEVASPHITWLYTSALAEYRSTHCFVSRRTLSANLESYSAASILCLENPRSWSLSHKVSPTLLHITCFVQLLRSRCRYALGRIYSVPLRGWFCKLPIISVYHPRKAQTEHGCRILLRQRCLCLSQAATVACWHTLPLAVAENLSLWHAFERGAQLTSPFFAGSHDQLRIRK